MFLNRLILQKRNLLVFQKRQTKLFHKRFFHNNSQNLFNKNLNQFYSKLALARSFTVSNTRHYRFSVLAAGFLLALLISNKTLALKQKPAKACGLVAFVCLDTNNETRVKSDEAKCNGVSYSRCLSPGNVASYAVDYILEGLQILLNRGYDSAGISTLRRNKNADEDEEETKYSLVTTKYASIMSTADAFEKLKQSAPERHKRDVIGIGHTRWATHGASTDLNSHPHHDSKNRISLVHNGTIENAQILKKELIEQYSIQFRSQTDTEVIAQLIGIYLDQGLDIEKALVKCMERIDGTYGLAIIDVGTPDRIIATRKGSPLIIGIGEHCKQIASEHTAFSRHTKQFVSILDGEIATITADDISIDTTGRLTVVPHEIINVNPDPYPHQTMKEISEQAEAVQNSLKFGGRFSDDYTVILGGLNIYKETLMKIKHLIIGGCGTSLNAALYGAKLMRYLNSFETVQPVDAAEINADLFSIKSLSSSFGLLAVSQSGETRDVYRAVQLAKSLDLFSFSIINAIGSLIARTTSCGVYTHAGREHGVASTKAFITQVTCLALVACWFSQNRESSNNSKREDVISSLHQLSTYCGMIIHHRQEICKKVAIELKDCNHIFVLGRGMAEPIAYEGALKIKEITYIHAEGYSGGALKHGPFALIEKGTPIILIILNDKYANYMRTACEEVKSRGARTIIISDCSELVDGLADIIIKIPSNKMLTALLAVVPLQIIAYELSVIRGINPDKPKNLAKAVTVD